eukprot:COSAG03_NODE_930_length_5274_cov_21.824348_1_plen_78_part_00
MASIQHMKCSRTCSDLFSFLSNPSNPMGKSTRSSTQTQIELHTLRVTGTPGTQLPVCQVLVKAVEATVLTRAGIQRE